MTVREGTSDLAICIPILRGGLQWLTKRPDSGAPVFIFVTCPRSAVMIAVDLDWVRMMIIDKNLASDCAAMKPRLMMPR